MRFGILGPAQGDLPALARGAQQLLDEARADKVLYLSDDDALDQVVAGWAQGLVGANAEEAALFDRAAAKCAVASHAEVDAFVASERARLRLKVLVSLPASPGRTIEFLDGRVVLFVYDKAALDEEDIVAASLLVFGKSQESMIKKVGTRTFMAPGWVTSETGGRALLDDASGGLRIEIFNAKGIVTAREFIGAPPRSGAKFKVQGGPAD
jgi:hypothetical protein